MAAATFRYIVQLHKDVPKAARFYSEGLGFTINVCTLRWAELHSGPLKLSLLRSPSSVPFFSDHVEQKGYSSLLSFTVTDLNSTMSKLMELGAELDGPIKYEIHGKYMIFQLSTTMYTFVTDQPNNFLIGRGYGFPVSRERTYSSNVTPFPFPLRNNHEWRKNLQFHDTSSYNHRMHAYLIIERICLVSKVKLTSFTVIILAGSSDEVYRWPCLGSL